MVLLLNIVHSYFPLVPGYMPIRDLYEISVLTDKCAMAHIL